MRVTAERKVQLGLSAICLLAMAAAGCYLAVARSMAAAPPTDEPETPAAAPADPSEAPNAKEPAGNAKDESSDDADRDQDEEKEQDDENDQDKEKEQDAEGDAGEHPFPRHFPAPPLDGGLAWINTAGPLSVRDLKGKFVLLDFWTYCCINCMHILPELKKLEKAYPNEVVVIGVHSAKFDGEQDSQNIIDAVLRYEIEHPVVNDANHAIWDAYGVESWPSLRIIDPEGNLVAGQGGEIKFEVLDNFFQQVLPYYRKKGVLDETPLKFDLAAESAASTPLRYPGKLLADEKGNRLFVADSNHNRIVVSQLDGTLLYTIGSGQIGRQDGAFDQASFNHPQGLALKNDVLYVADTENHMLRKVDLQVHSVATVAGIGQQAMHPWPGLDLDALNGLAEPQRPKRYVGEPLKTGLNSPWDLWIHENDLYIAMAGPHQIWKMPLDESEIGPYAGNSAEDIVDGPLLPEIPREDGYASFAQPSGLSSDGEELFVADSEGSSIRGVPFDPAKEVRTLVGTSHLRAGRLFAFGDIDGKGKQVRLQHCLGVCWLDGLLYIADTYNNKIKVLDPKTASVKTLAGNGKPGRGDAPAQFDEPAGLSAAAGKLYVADTNNHLVRVVDLKNGNQVSTLEFAGLKPPAAPKPTSAPRFKNARQVKLETAAVQPADGNLRFNVSLQLPEGYKINPKAPMSYLVENTGKTGPVDRASLGKSTRVKKPAAQFEIDLPLAAQQGSETLKVGLTYYYCQEGSAGLCKVGSVVWTVPVELKADAQAAAVPLELLVE